MPSLKTLLADFKPPTISAEEASAQLTEKEMALARQRIKDSGIPEIFKLANIATCPDDVQRFAQNPKGTGLVLRGPVGRGKTYAACAVLIESALMRRIRFVSAGDILRELQASFRSKNSEDVVSRLRNVPLLVIDDLGKEPATDWAMSQLFAVIDGRYAAARPTIYTTQLTGNELVNRLTVDGDSSFASAIVSRIATCQSVIMDGENRRNHQ